MDYFCACADALDSIRLVSFRFRPTNNDLVGVARLIFDSFEEDHGQYNDLREIFWATGACLCIRASIYHEVGGLDEDFFAHMEEIDLCWRLKNFGYCVYVVPESVMPSYPWLNENKLDGALTAKKMETFRNFGVPYTDADIQGDAASVKGKTEMEALIAYLQQLGTVMKQRR